MTNFAKRTLSGTLRLARGAATAMGLAVTLALTVGLASAALAGTGVGARLDLGKTNAVNAVTGLVGNVAGQPSLRIDNNSTAVGATALDLQVEPGKPPMKVNSTTEVQGLNVDSLDSKNSTDFLQESSDRDDFLPSRTYNNTGITVDNPGGFRTFGATCDAGDVALSGGHRMGTIGANIEILEERTQGDTYQMVIVGNGIITANVTCADFPPLK